MKLDPYPQRNYSLRTHSRFTADQVRHPERYVNHATHVIGWMLGNALRRLHEYARTNASFPEIEELEEWIIDNADEAERDFDAAKIYTMAHDAAVFALDVYDPKIHAARVAAGRIGGQTTTRRRAIFHIDQLHAVAHLSTREAAKKLGCSASTISTLRRRASTVDLAQRDAEIVALLGPVPELYPEMKRLAS